MERNQSAWAEVDLRALRRNYERIKTYTESEIMPIVKADAYGHGALEIVQALYGLGARRFGVALFDEALAIKKAFPDTSVMIIGAMFIENASALVQEDIISGVYQMEQAEALSKEGVLQGKTARIHIKVDTGMGRIGFREEDLDQILRIADLPNLTIEGIYTHFATSDHADLTFAREQLQRFARIYQKLSQHDLHIPIRHAANSAAILQLPEAHFELVRAGIILYGLPPSKHVGKDAGLEPVLSWKTRVTHIKTISAGETVSYGRTFKAAYPTRVATISVGYADGLRRALSNQGEAIVKGKRATMIGRICMDQTMLDVTKIPNVEVGDVVTLLGVDGYERIDATEMANWLNTINYEVVCGIAKRVKRVYLK